MEHETPEGVQESSFVRKDFYLEPPGKGATVEAWKAWLEADRQAAIQAKRAHTKSLAHADIPEAFQAKVLSKVGGVYRQSAMVGLVGEGDSTRIEAAVDASQEREIALARMEADQGKRGTKSKGRAARQRQAKRQARARRFGKGQN